MRWFLIVCILSSWFLLPGQIGFLKNYSEYSHTSSQTPAAGLKKYVLPASLITTGAFISINTSIVNKYKVRDWRNNNFSNFSTDLDDYLQYVPLVTGLALNLNRPKEDFNMYNHRVILSEAFVLLTVAGLKGVTQVPRPDGTTNNAFPSGHTTQAFAAATLFSDHFARHKWWLSALSYGTASSVGVLRILNNRHWISDVIAGAGLGILCVKLSESICKPKSVDKPNLYP